MTRELYLDSEAYWVRMVQQIPPGMMEFYSRFEKNPIALAENELVATCRDQQATEMCRLAKRVFERKIAHLARLYKEFGEASEYEAQESDYYDFVRDRVQWERERHLCDHCLVGAYGRKWLLMGTIARDENGDPEDKIITTVCDRCHRGPS